MSNTKSDIFVKALEYASEKTGLDIIDVIEFSYYVNEYKNNNKPVEEGKSNEEINHKI